MNLIRWFLLPSVQYREFQVALAAFRRLSQRQLEEAGIARADIVRLAFDRRNGARTLSSRAAPARRPQDRPAGRRPLRRPTGTPRPAFA